MPPVPVPGAGRGGGSCSQDDESADFSDSDLRALLGSSTPDRHLCVVGSLGALPASLGSWPPPAAMYHAPPLPALGDLESSHAFAFYPPVNEALEGEEDAEDWSKDDLDEEAAEPAGASDGAAAAPPTPTLDAPLLSAAQPPAVAVAPSKPASETIR